MKHSTRASVHQGAAVTAMSPSVHGFCVVSASLVLAVGGGAS